MRRSQESSRAVLEPLLSKPIAKADKWSRLPSARRFLGKVRFEAPPLVPNQISMPVDESLVPSSTCFLSEPVEVALTSTKTSPSDDSARFFSDRKRERNLHAESVRNDQSRPFL